jgi:hypothetical protein
LHLSEAVCEEVAFGNVRGQRDGTLVRIRTLSVSTEAAKEVGPCGVVEVGATEGIRVERVHEVESRSGPARHRNRDRVVERDDR